MIITNDNIVKGYAVVIGTLLIPTIQHKKLSPYRIIQVIVCQFDNAEIISCKFEITCHQVHFFNNNWANHHIATASIKVIYFMG